MKRNLLFIIGILIIVYIILTNTMSTSKIAFSMPCLILGVLLILMGALSKVIDNMIKRSDLLNKVYKLFSVGVLLFIIFISIIEVVIISYPKHNTEDSDYIMVLGAGLNGDYPSLTLSYRLNAAEKIFKELGESKKIIVSGGRGNDERISEAKAMKNYLLDKGIPENMILIEDKSSTTSENFKFSKEVIEVDSNKEKKDIKVKIVTTDFHAFRSRIIAKKNGYENVNNYSSNTVWYLIPINYLRESFAVVKSVIFD